MAEEKDRTATQDDPQHSRARTQDAPEPAGAQEPAPAEGPPQFPDPSPHGQTRMASVTIPPASLEHNTSVPGPEQTEGASPTGETRLFPELDVLWDAVPPESAMIHELMAKELHQARQTHAVAVMQYAMVNAGIEIGPLKQGRNHAVQIREDIVERIVHTEKLIATLEQWYAAGGPPDPVGTQLAVVSEMPPAPR